MISSVDRLFLSSFSIAFSISFLLYPNTCKAAIASDILLLFSIASFSLLLLYSCLLISLFMLSISCSFVILSFNSSIILFADFGPIPGIPC